MRRNPVYVFFSNLIYYGIALPVLWAADVLFFGLRIRGREHMRAVRGGAVLVCNHVHNMDCTFLGLAAAPRHLIFVSLALNFRIPVAGALIWLLGAVPVPQGMREMGSFLEQMTETARRRVVVIYPEGAILPYAPALRPFKSGAFYIAASAGVPVIPAVISGRKGKGFWAWRRKPAFTLTLGEALYPDSEMGSVSRQAGELRKRARAVMEKMLTGDGTEEAGE
ncbi:MAG: lysophospholipid acyltransferase family protein [Eubacteriales bacterium]|nr:lysophospholipid acyltransferase family protein [Eubacteriales bacterium]